MLAGMSPRQLTEHMAAARLEPFGWRQLAHMLSNIVATLHATAGGKVDPEDVLREFGYPDFEAPDETEEEEDEAIERSVRLGVAAFGGS